MKRLLRTAKRCVKLSNNQKAFKQLTCCNNGKLARSLWGLKEYFNNKSVNFIHSKNIFKNIKNKFKIFEVLK